ncbi:unnamed protein product [Notodromas monacha]|uniref:Uncharacterized protein n=1 Tax=Notodromas monacha TaxID=399045 RepID=A0A7R9BUN6_9CRUS|nr:unnamed protein product [Notodromas monacha]CAG0920724.1 unnamed protein product [Notodromas monacha]
MIILRTSLLKSCHNMATSGSKTSLSKGIQFGSAWLQRKIHIRPQRRGCHVVTDEVLKQVPELSNFAVGMCHIQILHTSASLALNENWDPDVRDDMEMMLNKIVPEVSSQAEISFKIFKISEQYPVFQGMPYKHSCEGPDDMPAHVKACFMGSSLTIPVTEGKLNLGTWQGIWLCEHRNHAGSRKLIVTLSGCLKDASGGRSPNSPGPST